MRFTLRWVQCMATRPLQEQQYNMFGVPSLLAAEKALLIRNDLAGMLLQRPIPRLPFIALGIQKLVDRWDKCLNELGQYLEK